ncbi:MAG: radical SAM protein [Gemmatimonadales bacterium]|nr:radical SAM protein [Gemmatimonadales bacterium]
MDSMSLEQKLALLMTLAGDDRDGAPPGPLPPRLRHTDDVGALRPLNLRTLRYGGGKARLLRILMTNACSFNCHYCPMRRDRTMPRTLLKPEELARIFAGALKRDWCDGLFVTTGIPGRPVKVMDDLITALELIRERDRFGGYIHVKIVPGAEPGQIDRLTQLASRVSVNLEAPCGASLTPIAPEKNLDVTLAALERARAQVVMRRAEERAGRPRDRLHPGGVAGITTQFVVGATPDSDRTILDRLTGLYERGGMHHAQFSAFRPIADTPMEGVRETPVLREHRLYQVDHLVRQYGFTQGDVVFDASGNLPLATDPKAASALAHPDRFPVEVRTAPYEELVRVPGIGPGTARRIVAERGATLIRSLGDLRKLGAITSRAAGFVTIGGRRVQTLRWEEQMGFWSADEQAGRPQMVYSVSPGTFR